MINTGGQYGVVKDGQTVVGKFDGLPINIPEDYDVDQYSDRSEWSDITVDDLNSNL